MKKFLIILLLLLPIIILYKITGYYFRHSVDWTTCNQYRWFFKDQVRKDMESDRYDFCFSHVKKKDIYNTFHYLSGQSRLFFSKMLSICYKESETIRSDKERAKESFNCERKFRHDHNIEVYPVTIWEFKDLKDIDLSKIEINQNVYFENMNLKSAEVFDSRGIMKVMIRYNFKFKNIMNINLDENSKIEQFFEGKNYKGFYGIVNRISFSDEKGKTQVIIDYSYNRASEYGDKPNLLSPTVFLLYKGHGSFYVIIINSEKPFKDESIINILNLK